MDFITAAKNLLVTNMGLRSSERLLVLYDETTLKIGESLFSAGQQLGASVLAIRMPVLPRNGMEPDPFVVEAMGKSDVVVPLGASITHTQARKKAVAAGARVATMPRITEDMFFNGPITADYEKVADLTRRVTKRLSGAHSAELVTGPEG